MLGKIPGQVIVVMGFYFFWLFWDRHVYYLVILWRRRDLQVRWLGRRSYNNCVVFQLSQLGKGKLFSVSLATERLNHRKSLLQLLTNSEPSTNRNQCDDLSTCDTTDNSLTLRMDLVLIAFSHTMRRRATRCLPPWGTGLERNGRSYKRQFRTTFSFKLIKRNCKEIPC